MFFYNVNVAQYITYFKCVFKVENMKNLNSIQDTEASKQRLFASPKASKQIVLYVQEVVARVI